MNLKQPLETYHEPITIKKFDKQDMEYCQDLFLQDKEIHVWTVRWRHIIPWIITNWQLMSAEEKNYVERFRLYEDRMRGATGKILTRTLLAQYMNIPIHDICINTGYYGKPYLANVIPERSVQYSVSHSGEIVLLSLGKFPKIGVDIEQIREFPDCLEIAQNFFTSEESRKISESRSSSTFFRYWTAKEAYVKALGEGLNKDLKSFEIKRNRICERGSMLADWQVVPIEISSEYSANVAVRIEGE
jgi:4'-phosphopantetheinyl transferase